MNWIELLQQRHDVLAEYLTELDRARIRTLIKRHGMQHYQRSLSIHSPEALLLVSCELNNLIDCIQAAQCRWRCVHLALLQLQMLLLWAAPVGLLELAGAQCEALTRLGPLAELVPRLAAAAPNQVLPGRSC
jgi:hypothetical protein